MPYKRGLLMILDGWGHGKKDASDAVFQAKTPFVDSLYTHPNAELLTHGAHVGLPDGQMGNSEVGHMNIGAGRIVYQDLAKINKAIAEGTFYREKALLEAMATAKKTGKKLHIMGLVSDGGVHSSIDHLKALIELAEQEAVPEVYLHAFTDGRDTDPEGGKDYLQDLMQFLEGKTTKIATLIGRYFAMDRDKRWERVAKAYNLLVNGEGAVFESPVEALKSYYAEGIKDEFIPPVIFSNTQGKCQVESGDVVICFNFRTDRCREISEVLTQQDHTTFGMQKLDLHYTTMTNYDDTFTNVNVVFDKDNLQKTMGEVVADHGLTQVRIAETEKYPHVTFFFSGGREAEFAGEKRLMAASPKVATYDLQPEMSAQEIADKICTEIEAFQPDFICLNFANPDMVGHTGVFEAIIKACEKVDACAQQVVEKARAFDYQTIIIADHGNADMATNSDGSPNTAHTTNPVPVFVLADGVAKVNDGVLADVAPTLLHLMGVDRPVEMTGKIIASN